MARATTLASLIALGTLTLACEEEKKPDVEAQKAEATASAAPEPEPEPEPEPAPSAEEPKEVEVPKWVDDYAAALCKRVAVCREKMLAAVGPQQKMMLSMQIPSQEACLKNTRTFKKTAPKAELDASEQKALAKCIQTVPTTACGNVQTGKVPECQTMVDLIAAAREGDGETGSGGSGP